MDVFHKVAVASHTQDRHSIVIVATGYSTTRYYSGGYIKEPEDIHRIIIIYLPIPTYYLYIDSTERKREKERETDKNTVK